MTRLLANGSVDEVTVEAFPPYIWLFLSATISGACLALVMAALYFSDPKNDFLPSIIGGVVAIVGCVLAYVFHFASPNVWAAQAFALLLIGGFVLFHRGFLQYLGHAQGKGALALSAAASSATALLIYIGLDGAGLVLAHVTVVALMMHLAYVLWLQRGDAPKLMTAAALICFSCAGTSVARIVALVMAGHWSLGVAPQNWAEMVAAPSTIICMTGLGPLVMALIGVRAQVQLKADAMTDALTGLQNRRAFRQRFDGVPVSRGTAVIMFDLDNFKRTNDVFGHAVGDRVLQHFAVALSSVVPAVDAFRLGGEEFAVVVENATVEAVRSSASRIAATFAEMHVDTKLGPIRSTVSAGISFGEERGCDMSVLLDRADQALYKAKESGRNRVVCQPLRQAG